MKTADMIVCDVNTARERLGALAVVGESDEQTQERYAAGVWSCLVEPGDRIAGEFIAARGYAQSLAVLSTSASPADEIAQACGLPQATAVEAVKRWMPRISDSLTRRAFVIAQRPGTRLLIPSDTHWPNLVEDLGGHAPLCLWVRGRDDVFNDTRPSIALVGARAATGYGEQLAAELSAECAIKGVTIVSGAAYGIDGAAHRAALASAGLTIAFLAGGIDRVYPSGHADMLATIAETGALISEMPCGTSPSKWRFLQRNRLIAAFSHGTVVVEAGWRSGSLNTAAHAATLGRPLGAVPGPVTSPNSAGCHRLLREYDAQCVTTGEEACEMIGLDTQNTQDLSGSEEQGAVRDHERIRLEDALSTRSSRSVVDIAQRAGLATEQVETLLGLLLLEGRVERSGNQWRRV